MLPADVTVAGAVSGAPRDLVCLRILCAMQAEQPPPSRDSRDIALVEAFLTLASSLRVVAFTAPQAPAEGAGSTAALEAATA